MPWDHHPEWTDDMVSEHYPSLCGPDGMVDWLALHQRDHDLALAPHLSDAE